MSDKLKFGFALFLVVSFIPFMVHAQSQSQAKASSPLTSGDYFPVGIFNESPQLDRSFASWYGRTLAALSEPSLFELRTDMTAQVYRFLWLPSFHRPISVRLTIRPDGSGSVVARSVDYHAGLLTKDQKDSGKLLLDATNTLNEVQVREVLNQLQDRNFWSTTPRDVSLGADGAEWLMEGVNGGKYHLVNRWSPESPGNRAGSNRDFALLCRYFLKLGGVDVKDLY